MDRLQAFSFFIETHLNWMKIKMMDLDHFEVQQIVCFLTLVALLPFSLYVNMCACMHVCSCVRQWDPLRTVLKLGAMGTRQRAI